MSKETKKNKDIEEKIKELTKFACEVIPMPKSEMRDRLRLLAQQSVEEGKKMKGSSWREGYQTGLKENIELKALPKDMPHPIAKAALKEYKKELLKKLPERAESWRGFSYKEKFRDDGFKQCLEDVTKLINGTSKKF